MPQGRRVIIKEMKVKDSSLFQYYSHYLSPLGQITLLSDGVFLTGLLFPTQGRLAFDTHSNNRDDLDVFILTKTYLDLYFSGEKSLISPPLRFEGTPFQEEVWRALIKIPYGELKTYGDLAKDLAKVRGKRVMSSQAVGQAVGQNPISLIIPCHRVIGANDRLIGYSGGLSLKRNLLSIEGHDLNRYID